MVEGYFEVHHRTSVVSLVERQRPIQMELIIRAERPGDELAIRYVLLTAFATAQEAELIDRLRKNARLSISLIAECDNTIIGQSHSVLLLW